MGIIIRYIKLAFFRMKWRRNNKHNYTTPHRIFDTRVVNVGRFSYGPLHVYSFGSINEKLSIGDFVSISSDVKFVLGGNHAMGNLSTFPFKAKLLREGNESYSKGPIIVGDDVWIGMNCVILSGLKIGQGAVIAAGSVVVGDIPPYSIVGGNPAKIIKYRFKENIIEQLSIFKFSELGVDFLLENIDLVYSPIDYEVLEKLRELIAKRSERNT
jgi:acetyltransferase-like isoleucine patch superfamily enzyme